MAINPLLLNVKPISEITTVNNPIKGHLLFYDGSDELKKVDIIKFQSTTVYYVHDQFSPSSLWVIEHNLDKKPSVSVVDTAGNLVEGAIQYIDDNKLTIEFNYPFSGYAYLN